MSRRARRDELNISLDSLLDAMFNVVGILVLVLILAQLSVSGAVERLQVQVEDLPEIDPQAMERAEQRAAELREQIARLSENAEVATEQMEGDRITLTRLEAQLDRLKEMVALDPELTAERERIKEVLQELREQHEDVNTNVSDASDELQRLRAVLAETPERAEPTPEVVMLPNPRDAPEGWTPEYVLVTNGRVYVYHIERMRERIRQYVEAARRVPEDEQNTGGRDRAALERRLEIRPIEYRDFKVELEVVGRYDNVPRFVFTPLEDAGTGIDELRDPRSTFFRAVRAARSQRSYLIFWVTPDSFQAYLRARELADQHEVPAGWELRHQNWLYRYTLSSADHRLNQSKAKIAEIDKQLAERAEERAEPTGDAEEDKGPTIPPPAVERDVGGVID
ncbi:MAG: hypothetical protein ACODAQ_02860 [Phycisphaeraceae bacterium]